MLRTMIVRRKMHAVITVYLELVSYFCTPSRTSFAIPVSLGRKVPLCEGRYSVNKTCIQKLTLHLSMPSVYFGNCFVKAWLSLTSICFIAFSSSFTLLRYCSRILSQGCCSMQTLLSTSGLSDLSSPKITLNFS